MAASRYLYLKSCNWYKAESDLENSNIPQTGQRKTAVGNRGQSPILWILLTEYA